ncbi:MAG TPA: HAMP domain-containing sensor histidine kinase [Polyangiaceae bacterium]|nr:HAMP domain-containing sensor histidine kinase [Polyangiaceae bacterium]
MATSKEASPSMRSMPPAPSMRGPVVVCALFVLAMGVVLAGRSASSVRDVVVPVAGVLFGVGAVLSFVRAQQVPAERSGWLLLGAARALMAVAAIAMLATPVDGAFHAAAYVAFLLPLVDNALVAAGLWAWPWRTAPPDQRLPHVLGSLLFIGSVIVLLWLCGTWTAGLHGDPFIRLLLVGFGIHVALVGGTGLYLVSQATGRMRGPLGWIVAGVVAASFILGLLQRFLTGTVVWGPLFAVLFAGPLGYILAALCRRPVDPADESPSPRWRLLLYVPYAVVGTDLGFALARHREDLTGPTLAFLGLTAVLLARQFVLLEELRESYRLLETRVRQRTLDLEAIQSAVVRTERMNLAATLGAGLAHNLNNALTVILATAGALEERFAGRAEAEPIADVSEAARRAAGLTKRLMHFARQTREETPGAIDLGEAASGIEGLLRVFLGRDIDLTMELEPAQTPVMSTRSRFEQILVNLVSNARDVLPAGGHIDVKIRHVNAEVVELCVEDDGPGMAPDVREHLFEPFFTTKGEGTGLGLVSVKALAEQDGGAVTVESQPGRGTAFHVTWPSAPDGQRLTH